MTSAAQTAAELEARACCGPAHGHRWVLATPDGPPPSVLLPVAHGAVPYRLARQPRTRRPVRDHEGRYLYFPAEDRPAWAGG